MLIVLEGDEVLLTARLVPVPFDHKDAFACVLPAIGRALDLRWAGGGSIILSPKVGFDRKVDAFGVVVRLDDVDYLRVGLRRRGGASVARP